MHKIILNISVAIFLLSSVCVSGANENKSDFVITPFNPDQISKTITEQGASAVLKYIFDSQKLIEQMNSGIRSGETSWLKLFIPLKAASDGFWSTVLNSSIGYSLANNPVETLVTIDAVQTETAKYLQQFGMISNYPLDVCGNVDEDWGEGEDFDLKENAAVALQEISRRINALKSVDSSRYQLSYEQCLESLNKAEARWKDRLRQKKQGYRDRDGHR